MRSFLSKSIKWGVNVLIFLFLVSPSFIITCIGYQQLEQELTTKLFAERTSLARIMGRIVDSRLEATKQIVTLSASRVSTNIEKENWQDAAEELAAVSQEFPYIDRIFITDDKGIAKGFFPPSPQTIGGDFSHRDWYKGVTQTQKAYVSEVFKRAPEPQFNTVAVVAPIKNQNNERIGVLGFAINLDSFYQITSEFKVGDNGFLYIVDQHGQIVAHPKYPPQGPITDFSSVPFVQKALDGESGVTVAYNPVDKEERLSAYQPIPESNWAVVIADPVQSAFMERETALNQTLRLDALFILVNVLFALVTLASIARVKQANQKLKELDKVKDEFVSVASHELRTPLTAISGYTDMILSGDYGKITKSLQEPISDIRLSAERLINLVSDMLNVSRIQAGRLKYDLQNVRVTPILQKVIRELTPVAQHKGVELVIKNLPDVEVQVDQEKVEQVIHNLVGNSLKFTDSGSITLTANPEKEHLRISITDTGMGIAAEDQQKLFGKFQQITSQQKGKPTGTGLGLFISREIIQKMGGDLILEKSALGQGSTFSFTLPLSNTETARSAETVMKNEQVLQTNPKK